VRRNAKKQDRQSGDETFSIVERIWTALSIDAIFRAVNYLLRSLLVTLSVSLFCSCSTVSDLVVSNVPSFKDGKASVMVSLSEQRAYLYRGGDEVTSSRISTGREGFDTPTGRFRVIRKDEDHRSSLYGDYVDDEGRVVKANVDTRKHPRPPGSHFVGAPMPFFVEFKPGFGLHAGHLPGYPASHGCVRMPYWRARQFFNTVDIGTPITVKR
jgi:lipoprotein-anchoring transpeptidase ErfK/SrfK